MALMSGKVYSNTGAPSNADGVNGDIYMQLDGFKTTYRKEGGSWVAVGSTLGAIPEFVSGVGVPSNSLGTDGQYYRNSANQDIYYKQGGTWALVGNLTGVAFQEVLVRAGIGKDLATPPNLINSGTLNSYTTQGEYFYTNTVTNTPTPYGLVKVWRENATYIYQLVQAAGNGGRLFNRYSGDGGATWGSWMGYASTDLATTTLAGIVEKATQVELNNGTADVWPDAATLLNGFSTDSDSFKLPEFLGGWKIKWGHTFLGDDAPVTAHTTTITGFTEIKMVLIGSTTSDNYGAFIYHRQSFDNNSVTVIFDEWVSQIQYGLGYWWLAIGK